MINFKNKIAYIIGGSSGIGLATAKLLFEHGTKVIIFSRDEQKLVRAVTEIKKQPSGCQNNISWLQMDVSKRLMVDTVLDEAVNRYGIPDILINSAGRAYPHYFEDISYEQFEETIQINLYGIWHTTQKLVPLMKIQGGYIVNVSSIAGLIGVFGLTDYCASKFAIIGFSEALRSELKPHNIMVSVLCPPDTDTPALEVENRTKPIETNAISENAGLMQPEDVAKALIKGMQKKQPLIIPGTQGKFSGLAKRLAPNLVEWVMDRSIQKVQKSKND
ncbi:MAG: SDR family oxidoreductase [Deltaproteobacteria bacterium]|nr:SDR family oxidoreductase [Deltaproteobacteria bacterium]